MITYWWAGTLFANRLQCSRCSWWDGRTKRTVASFKSWSLGVDWSSQNSWWSAHWRSNCGLSIDHSNFCGDIQIIASVSAWDIARNDTSQVSAPIESAKKYTKLDEKVTENIGIFIPNGVVRNARNFFAIFSPSRNERTTKDCWVF